VSFVVPAARNTAPRAKMAAGPMKWAADVTDRQFRTIGLLEVLGAIGLIVRPSASRSR
jgi:hypothetical protein